MENSCLKCLTRDYSIDELDRLLRIANLRLAYLIEIDADLEAVEKIHKINGRNILKLISNAEVA